jgi:DNA modification methylase
VKATSADAKHDIPPELVRFAVAIDSVQRWPGNPRNHHIEKLRKSLRKYGQPKPILAQASSRNVFAGNGILEAAEAEGWTHIAVTFRDWPDLTCREFLVDDNKTHDEGGDDFDRLARFLADLHADGGVTVGFEQRELDKFLASVSATPADEDDVPEVAPEAVYVKPGEQWQLGDHLLAVGDAFDADVLARLFDGSAADCVFTSPPYAVGLDYGAEYEDTLANLRGLIASGATTWQRIVRPGGFAVLNFGDVAAGREAAGSEDVCEYPMALEYWPVFRAAGWALWSRRVWCKPNPRVHSPWAIQSNRAATDFEHVWTWKAPGDPIVRRLDGRHASANGWFDTTREEGVEVGKEVHGAGMATSAAARMLAIHSERGGIVHEPFAGTGTTIIAAQQLERRCFATEISPRYAQIAISRWENYTGEKAVRR